MAACGSIQPIFDNPLPENQPLLESLTSWTQMKPAKPVDHPSYTEIFGKLHFKDKAQSPSSSAYSSSSTFPVSSFSPCSSFIDLLNPQTGSTKLSRSDSFDRSENRKNSCLDSYYAGCHKKGDSCSSMKSESLQLCTEGLGFESFDDVEELKIDVEEAWRYHGEKVSSTRHSMVENPSGEFSRRSRSSGGGFPPPISCIGKSGKPWVCFKSYRHDGRFVLKEVRIPTQEFLHARREDGRLKMHFVQPNDEIIEESEDEEVKEYSYSEDYEQEEYEEGSSRNNKVESDCDDDG